VAARTAAVSLAVLLAAVSLQSREQARDAAVSDGSRVELTVTPLEGARDRLTDGADVTIRLRITDAVTGAPSRDASPAGWMTAHAGDSATPSGCRARVSAFLSGNVFAAPEVEINASYVIGLNEDATVTVLNPQRGFGGTRLVALVPLPAAGNDWALSSDSRRLFVAVPAAKIVAVIDTAQWRVAATLSLAGEPSRVAVQPDGGYVWVTTTAGVQVYDARTLRQAAALPLTAPAGAIAFSDDSARAFVAMPDAGRVAVFSVAPLAKVAEMATGARVASLAYSGASDAAWAIDDRDGAVAAIDARRPAIVLRSRADAGVSSIGFTGRRRYGILLNPSKGVVQVIDSTDGKIVQTSRVNGSPDRIVFSRDLAYLVSRSADVMTLVPLDAVGSPGTPVPASEVPFGGSAPAAAAPIARADAMGAMALASARDNAVHIYREGMAAPMATLSNDRRTPRAVLVVDRGFRETAEPGVYEAIARLPAAGRHDLVVFSQQPRAAHCFALDIMPANGSITAPAHSAPVVTPLPSAETAIAGKPYAVRFALAGPDGRPATGRDDVQVLIMLAPGTWHRKVPARAGVSGTYSADIVPPAEGVYYAYVESPGLGIALGNSKYYTFAVRRAD
jgi:hypothetical protein